MKLKIFQFYKILDTYERKKVNKLLMFSFLNIILDTFSISLLIPLINLFLGNDSFDFLYIDKIFLLMEFFKFQDLLLFTFGIIMIAFLTKNIYLIWFTHWQLSLLKNITINLQRRLLNFYINQDYSFHVNTNSSFMIRNLTTNVASFTANITYTLLYFTEIVVFTLLILLMIFTNTHMFLFLIIIIGIPSIIFGYIIKKYITAYGEKIVFYSARSIKNLLQALNSFREIKIFNKEKLFLDGYISEENFVQENQRKATYIKGLPKFFFEILLIFTLFIIFVSAKILDESLDNVLVSMSIILIISLRIIPSITKILFSLNSIKKNEKAVSIIEQDVAQAESLYDKINEYNLENINFDNKIEIKNLFFKHDNEKENILENINLELNLGSIVGIKGPSGSGKSTLMDIILGLLQPTKGKIIIDGKEQKLFNNKSWQTFVGYVSQKIFLIDDTIENNITFKKILSVNEEKRLSEILKNSQLQEINSLLSKKKFLINEDGSSLSGGEKQRIGIARMLFKNTKIIILDESTNAIDLDTEKKILNYLSSIKKNKLIILISHNSKVLEICDYVYKLENKNITKNE